MIMIFIIVVVLIIAIALLAPIIYERFTQYDRTRFVIDNIKRQAQHSAMTWTKLKNALFVKMHKPQEIGGAKARPLESINYNTDHAGAHIPPNNWSNGIAASEFYIDPKQNTKQEGNIFPEPFPAQRTLVQDVLDFEDSVLNDNNAPPQRPKRAQRGRRKHVADINEGNIATSTAHFDL